MKIQLHHIIFLAFIAATAVISPVRAQDSNTADFDVSDPERDKLEKDKILYSPGEGESHYIPKTLPSGSTTPKDSIAGTRSTPVLQPKAKPEPPVKAAEKHHQPKDDDSILSFNFLYYIIEKYKLQDIID
jgi:hypothetical protein